MLRCAALIYTLCCAALCAAVLRRAIWQLIWEIFCATRDLFQVQDGNAESRFAAPVGVASRTLLLYEEAVNGSVMHWSAASCRVVQRCAGTLRGGGVLFWFCFLCCFRRVAVICCAVVCCAVPCFVLRRVVVVRRVGWYLVLGALLCDAWA